MRVVGNAKALASALSVVARAAPARTTLPALTACRLAVTNGAVELAATDLDVSLVLRPAGVVGEGTGAVLLPARFLADLFRRLDGEFELEARGSGVELRCGQGRFDLNAMDPSSYPQIPVPQKALDATVEFGFLRRVASRVGFACLQEPSRPALTGILWEEGPEGLVLVATDATRLACWVVAKQVVGGRGSVVVPGRAVELVAGMPDPGGEVGVVLGGSHVFFTSPAWTVSSRLIASPFPAWRTVLPQGFVASFVVPRREFAAALERAAVVSGDGAPVVRLTVSQNGVTLEASREGGRAHEELDARVEGGAVTSVFNARLLLEGLSAFEGEKLRFSLAGPEAVSELSDPDDPNYRYLVLPLRQ